LFSSSIFAAEDVGSYCFGMDTNVLRVQSQIAFLQTGNDKIQIRSAENCLDIYSTSDRLKLYEKMIFKNFKPINSETVSGGDDTKNHCRVEFIETRKKDVNNKVINISNDSKISQGNVKNDEVTTSEIMMSPGKKSFLTVGERQLSVECVKTIAGIYQLSFYFGEQRKASLETTVSAVAGQVIDVGNIVKEIDNKTQTIGVPVTEMKSETGTENIKFELKVL
jgi:hypothetical protein